jgi:hypothetical protein
MALIHVEIDPRHVDNDRSTGCIPEQSCVPQRNWCGPMGSAADMLFKVTDYDTGGVSIAMKDLGFYSLIQVTQPLALTPYLEKFTDTGQHLCYGISIDMSNPCVLKVVLCDENGEVADGTLVNKEFWLRIYGLR